MAATKQTGKFVDKRSEGVAEKREETRHARFADAYTCRLVTLPPEEREIPIRPVDVSRRGFGFIIRESIKVGQCFWLGLDKRRFYVEVAYCGSHLGIDGLYRCGVFLREADGDLHQACEDLGLLDHDHLRRVL